MPGKRSSEPTQDNPVPAEGDARAAFARAELDARAAAESSTEADDPGAPSAPFAAARDPVADALDASAVARLVMLGALWFGLRRRRRVTADFVARLAQRRARVTDRSRRVGERFGPRLGLLLGDGLLFVGLIAEGGAEVLEDSLDGLLEEPEESSRTPASQAIVSVPGGAR